jgi:PPOX class probable F420-dependent enzyme
MMERVALEPVASRPRFDPGYGISESTEGMLSWNWAVERLEVARNYWIGTARSDGSPHAAPVWGLWIGDAVLFSTSPDSRKGRNLARDPRVVVHLESGDEVVILEGEVERVALDEGGANAYEAKYDVRPDPGSPDGLWYAVHPRVAFAWLESDYPRTATRFAFD